MKDNEKMTLLDAQNTLGSLYESFKENYKPEFLQALEVALDAMDEKAEREREAKTADRAFIEYVKENTICGFPIEDLKKLAITLRELHIEPQDIKDANKIAEEAIKYTIARYNDHIEKTFARSVEDYFLNGGKEDKVDKKELSIRWGIRQGAKTDEIEKRREK